MRRRLDIRSDKDSNLTEMIRVNLRNILENPLSAENLKLHPFDELTIFSREKLMPPRPRL